MLPALSPSDAICTTVRPSAAVHSSAEPVALQSDDAGKPGAGPHETSVLQCPQAMASLDCHVTRQIKTQVHCVAYVSRWNLILPSRTND